MIRGLAKVKASGKSFQSLHKHFNHRKKTEDEVNSILPQKKEPFFVFVLFTLNFFSPNGRNNNFFGHFAKKGKKVFDSTTSGKARQFDKYV
jgi:hypothetical protein